MKKTIFLTVGILVMIFGAYSSFAQDLSLQTDKSEYAAGEQLELGITLDANPGAHGIFFDLEYDGSLMRFDQARLNADFYELFGKCELLWAEKILPGGRRRLVVSAALNEAQSVFYQSGKMLRLSFLLLGGSEEGSEGLFQLVRYGALDSQGELQSKSTVISSNPFVIENPHSGTFLRFISPYLYEVYEAEYYPDLNERYPMADSLCQINLQYSAEGNYQLRLFVVDREGRLEDVAIGPFQQADGYILDQDVPLVYGFNTIKAKLYAMDGDSGKEIASDQVTVFLRQDDKNFRLLSPQPHQYFNQDYITVEAASIYSEVKVNNEAMSPTSEKVDDIPVFRKEIWLQKGFNTIELSCKDSAKDIVLRKEIAVYYDKGEGIFRFVSPQADSLLRITEDMTIPIRGEISSLYREERDAQGDPVPNVIALQLFYEAFNPSFTSASFQLDGTAVIEENPASMALAPYIFRPEEGFFLDNQGESIDFSALKPGEITVRAFKNKTGEGAAEDQISLSFNLIDNKLSLEMDQPRVKLTDKLDRESQLALFDSGYTQSGGLPASLELDAEGRLALAAGDYSCTEIINSQNSIEGEAVSLCEDREGSLYLLTNKSASEEVLLYQKKISGEWQEIARRSAICAYDLVSTPMGLFMAASNLYNKETESGIYQLKKSVTENGTSYSWLPLKSDQLDFPHVQFLCSRGSDLFFYGNFYSKLYHFNIYNTLKKTNAGVECLDPGYLYARECSNSMELKDFYLSPGTDLAAMLSKAGDFQLLKKDAGRYSNVEFSNRTSLLGSIRDFAAGEYAESPYTVFWLLPEDTTDDHRLLSFNRDSGMLLQSTASVQDLLADVDDNAAPIQISFQQCRFLCLYGNTAGTISLKEGTILFNQFSETKSITFADPDNNSIANLDSSGGELFYSEQLGYSLFYPNIEGSFLYRIKAELAPEGLFDYHYSNSAAEGIYGFSFLTQTSWLEEENSPISLYFSLQSLSGTGRLAAASQDGEVVDLKTMLNLESSDERPFTIESQALGASSQSLVTVLFDDNQVPADLDLKLSFRQPVNSALPVYIQDLSIQRRTVVQINWDGSSSFSIPFRGRVNDPTVEFVSFNNKDDIYVEENGYFYYNYQLEDLSQDDEKKSRSFEISCRNADSDSASIKLDVEIILSKCWLRGPEDDEISPTPDDADVVNADEITVSGEYGGLKGCLCGYRIYSDSEESLLLGQGLLQTSPQASVTPPADLDISDNQQNYYEWGSYSGKIELIPGPQYLVFYCENPGGGQEKTEACFINYQVPEEDQNIEFTNISISASATPADFTVDNIDFYPLDGSPFILNEQPGEGQTRDYRADITIEGFLNSQYACDFLVRAYQNESATDLSAKQLLFADGSDFTLLTLAEDKSFSVDCSLLLRGTATEADFYLAFIPDAPSLTYLKKGIVLSARKDLEHNDFEPDFSLLKKENWPENTSYLTVPFYFYLQRTDVPDVPEADLTMNYNLRWADSVTCSIAEYEAGNSPDGTKIAYKLVEDPSDPSQSTHRIAFEQGNNRLSWDLMLPDGTTLASSDQYGDFIYNYEAGKDDFSPQLDVSFSPPLLQNAWYSDNEGYTVPEIRIEHGEFYNFKLFLNSKEVTLYWNSEDTSTSQALSELDLEEGRNTLLARWDSGSQEYQILYDTKEPLVTLASYEMNGEKLASISFTVKEMAIADIQLKVDGNNFSASPAIENIGEGHYLMSWHWPIGLSFENVQLEITDQNGQIGSSALFTAPDQAQGMLDNFFAACNNIPLHGGSPTPFPTDFPFEEEAARHLFSKHAKVIPGNRLPLNQVNFLSNNTAIRWKSSRQPFNLKSRKISMGAQSFLSIPNPASETGNVYFYDYSGTAMATPFKMRYFIDIYPENPAEPAADTLALPNYYLMLGDGTFVALEQYSWGDNGGAYSGTKIFYGQPGSLNSTDTDPETYYMLKRSKAANPQNEKAYCMEDNDYHKIYQIGEDAVCSQFFNAGNQYYIEDFEVINDILLYSAYYTYDCTADYVFCIEKKDSEFNLIYIYLENELVIVSHNFELDIDQNNQGTIADLLIQNSSQNKEITVYEFDPSDLASANFSEPPSISEPDGITWHSDSLKIDNGVIAIRGTEANNGSRLYLYRKESGNWKNFRILDDKSFGQGSNTGSFAESYDFRDGRLSIASPAAGTGKVYYCSVEASTYWLFELGGEFDKSKLALSAELENQSYADLTTPVPAPNPAPSPPPGLAQGFSIDGQYFLALDSDKATTWFTDYRDELLGMQNVSGVDQFDVKLMYNDNPLSNVKGYFSGLENGFKDIVLEHPAYTDCYDVSNTLTDPRFPQTKVEQTLSSSFTLSFWFRLEEQWQASDAGLLDQVKKILSLQNSNDQEILSFGYQQKTSGTFNIGTIENALTSIETDYECAQEAWRHCVIRYKANSDILDVYLSDTNNFNTSEESINITNSMSKAVFMPELSAANPYSGSYSLASAHSWGEALSDSEIEMLYNLEKDGSQPLESEVASDSLVYEHAGQIKAYSQVENFIKTDSESPAFHRASTINLTHDYTSTGNSLTLTNYIVERKGTYYLASAYSEAYGIPLSPCYSLSGEADVPADVDLELFLEINGRIEKQKIGRSAEDFSGNFCLRFNYTDNEAPSSVRAWFELQNADDENPVRLSNLHFRASNVFAAAYHLDSLPADNKSGVSAYCYLREKTTLYFDYQPYNINSQGLVNDEAVLFDSEFFQVFTELDASREAVYCLKIKQQDGTYKSAKKVSAGWHRLEAQINSVDNQIKLYVDGEEVINESPINILSPSQDSREIRIGQDLAGESLCEGAIQNFKLAPGFYSTCQNQNPGSAPASCAFSGGFVSTVDNNGNPENFILMNSQGAILQEETTLDDIHLDDIPSGMYSLFYRDNISDWGQAGHVINMELCNTPRFVLENKTSVLFTGENNPLDIKVFYDQSFLLPDINNQLAAVKGALYAEGANSPFKQFFLTQDYNSPGSGQWLVSYDNGVSTQSASKNDSGFFTLAPTVFASDFEANGLDNKVNLALDYFYYDYSNVDENLCAHVCEWQDNDKNDDTLSINSVFLYPFPDDEDDEDVEAYKMIASLSELDENDKSNPDFEDAPSGVEMEIIVFSITRDSSDSIISQIPCYSDRFDLHKCGREFYFDDIFPSEASEYKIKINLYRNGDLAASAESEAIDWLSSSLDAQIAATECWVEITDFSLLNLDLDKKTASLLLKYNANNFTVDDDSPSVFINPHTDEQVISVSGNNPYLFEIENIEAGRSYEVRAKISGTKADTESDVVYSDEKTIEISTDLQKPRVEFLEKVDSYISYNTVRFAWQGSYQGKANAAIRYQYNMNGRGWTSLSTDVLYASFFNLDEGFYNFQLRAEYMGNYSIIKSIPFHVDIERPQIRKEDETGSPLFSFLEDRNGDGAINSIVVQAASGAIEDLYLTRVLINGVEAYQSADGGFASERIFIDREGIIPIRVEAFDIVGNRSVEILEFDNRILNIDYPEFWAEKDVSESVFYCPLTVKGRINNDISAQLEIFLRDPFCPRSAEGDFSGWRRAKINEDRVFFVEDVLLRPGSRDMQIETPLEIACRFPSGKVFYRSIKAMAGSLRMPIEVEMSAHASEGETAETEVVFDCRAMLDLQRRDFSSAASRGIASWSIDFQGDGIYDEINLTHMPYTKDAEFKSWRYVYSKIGEYRPRIRVISTDGQFFSVQEKLIIHEKIKDAVSPMNVASPLSMDLVRTLTGQEHLLLLCERDKDPVLDFYLLEEMDAAVKVSTRNLPLKEMGMQKPFIVRANSLSDIFIAENRPDGARLYWLKLSDTGNYLLHQQEQLEARLYSMAVSDKALWLSGEQEGKIYQYNFIKDNAEQKNTDWVLSGLSQESWTANCPYAASSFALSAFGSEVMVADNLNTRLMKLGSSGMAIEFFGKAGSGEGEFINPLLIEKYVKRSFVYDHGRKDIQVFDEDYKLVCTLQYSHDPDYYNYLAEGFLDDLADISVITRENGSRIYYYLLLLSRSNSQFVMLRLPQWEELRAKVRNNKIVYIKEGEVFSAKPDGSDLTRLLSTDSLPEIQGSLDYPALAPDGQGLLISSSKELYNTEFNLYNEENYGTDNLYYYNLSSKKLRRVGLGALEGYAIERPIFNSNGDYVLFSAKRQGGFWQVYLMELENSMLEQLTEGPCNSRHPYFSPDDRFVVFASDYSGSYNLEVLDRQNPDMRVQLTENSANNYFPVWSRCYPGEIRNEDLDVESKIAFVSEKNFHKSVYLCYMQRKSDNDIRFYNFYENTSGGDPEEAHINLLSGQVLASGQQRSASYPCFTGDGTKLYFETRESSLSRLLYLDLAASEFREKVSQNGAVFNLQKLEYFENVIRPAGMKNMITGFQAKSQSGNEIALSWLPYTDKAVPYLVEFFSAADNNPVRKTVLTQGKAVLSGLEMGQVYYLRVLIKENGEEVTTSEWKRVEMDKVAAIPSWERIEGNPYGILLKAWYPGRANNERNETGWKFSWTINGQAYEAGESADYPVSFAESGWKTIKLKAVDSSNKNDVFSQDFKVYIHSEVVPVIDYTLAADSSSISFNALNSEYTEGSIDWSKSRWFIWGGDQQQSREGYGQSFFCNLDGFDDRISVSLTLARKTGIAAKPIEEISRSLEIDLDFTEVRPVITDQPLENDPRTIRFSGQQSLGNIDWNSALWNIFRNGEIIGTYQGQQSILHNFPETSQETRYTVSLSVKRASDGQNEVVSQQFFVDPTPLELVIDYEVITLEKDENTVISKVLLDATKSRGSGIDFNSARWDLPVAANYGESSSQSGPTAIFSLNNIEEEALIEVALTLSRRNGEAESKTEIIRIGHEEIASTVLAVNTDKLKTETGTLYSFDVLSSSGPGIKWENISWEISYDGRTEPRQGPQIQIEVPAGGEASTISYLCRMPLSDGSVLSKRGREIVDAAYIFPIISTEKVSANSFRLDVLQSEGANIDWERTRWMIYDGNENVVEKRGARVVHAFALTEEQIGYPVQVEMFLKGSSLPFYGYKSVEVEADELRPVIWYDQEGRLGSEEEEIAGDEYTITFSANGSQGGNIDWSKTRWSFGDSSEAGYGPVVSHKYAYNGSGSYRVSLTIFRTLPDGSEEVKSCYKQISFEEEKVEPVISAARIGDTIIFSCEDSVGKGLLLDRSFWMFDGEGDTVRLTETDKTTVYNTETRTLSVGSGASFRLSNGVATFTASANVGYTNQWNLGNTTDSISNSDYSTTNTHTGLVCRRSINPLLMVYPISLTVYRMTDLNTVEAETINAIVNVDDIGESPTLISESN